MNITHTITSRGGLVATHELLALGFNSHALTRLTRMGVIVRVRQGWYATPLLADVLQRAVRVGGVLGCVSAARVHGLAVTEPQATHVCLVRGSSRLRSAADYRVGLSPTRDGVVVHWSRRTRQRTRLIQDVPSALRDMALCQPPERTIAAVDSALGRGLLSLDSWLRQLDSLPRRLADVLRDVDRRCESITESVARFRLRALGYIPRIQVSIAGVGRVDMVLGSRLVLEFDGWEYHGDRVQFENDRRRDALLATRGYRVLRFSYRQVMERWHEVKAAIEGALRSSH